MIGRRLKASTETSTEDLRNVCNSILLEVILLSKPNRYDNINNSISVNH